ncbi:MAG: monomethylamine:corrinoid methyltransferase [Chloroflexi bacterium]|nr:monomethylamine:corrinoid methyltransferase [Chloroflexota bacterium]
MLSLLDIAERTQKGPKMEEKDWNLGLFHKVSELAREHGIAYPGGDTWFNTDDDLAERAFRAGLDFLTQMGIYCVTTNRVIQLTKEEVLAAAREAPREIIVGADRDARVIRKQPMETRGPLNFRPGHHAPFSEELAPLIVKNFAEIHGTDYLEGFNFTQTDGREVYGMPLEAYAARREIAWMREGVRKAGKQGLAVALYPISTRAGVLVAPMDPDYGLRRTDGCMLSVLPDVKIELDLLTAAMVYEDYGCFRVNGGGSGNIGGFCGGVEGAVVEGMVKPIVGFLAYRDRLSYAGVGTMARTTTRTINADPRVVWGSSVVCQALNRHTNVITFGAGGGGGSSGPGTETHLVDCAMQAVVTPINGNNLTGARQGRARMNASQSPLEAEWKWEVAEATMRAGLTRDNAGEVLSRLAARIQGKPPEPGLYIPDIYDLVRHQPKPAYREIYLRVKEQVAAAGLPLA